MPYEVDFTEWRMNDDGSRDIRSSSGFFDEDSPVECVNAILYERRGLKSDWELAYVDDVREVG